jgi:hypothetical protein
MPRATQAVALVPHPATPGAAALSILVQVARDPATLSVRYVLAGDLERLSIPPRAAPTRRDGLWRHTCFELFVGAPGLPAYQEFNFSPSGEWAAYRFSGYREGAEPLDCGAPAIDRRQDARELTLDAAVACLAGGALRLGLSAVVEDEDGGLSYWALRHAGARPDFHDARSFALEVDEVRH